MRLACGVSRYTFVIDYARNNGPNSSHHNGVLFVELTLTKATTGTKNNFE